MGVVMRRLWVFSMRAAALTLVLSVPASPASLALSVARPERLSDLPIVARAKIAAALGRPWTQLAELHARRKYTKYFGLTMAMSGNTLVVGAPGGPYYKKGTVCVFVKPKSGWKNMTQLANLFASDGARGDYFGSSVSISGDTVLVGAETASDERGSAYLFVKPEGGWRTMPETAKLTPSDGRSGDEFGTSVSVDANTAFVGSYSANGGHGKVYVFLKPQNGWSNASENAQFAPSDGSPYYNFGVSMAHDLTTMVVGAFSTTVGSHQGQGAAYVFLKTKNGWGQPKEVAELTASDGAAGDLLGRSVSLSSNTIAAGAPDNAAGGAAYVYIKPNTGWVNMTETAKLTASDGGGSLGGSVSIGGDTVAAGAATNPDLENVGAAYVYAEPTGGWKNMTETVKLTASDGESDDFLGASVLVDDSSVMAGAPGHITANQYNGAVYVFEP